MKSFYESPEWLMLRYMALRLYGGRCQCCGNKGKLHVDHIKPRSLYPELELTLSNLQVTCESCNLGKSNKFEDDWRGLPDRKPTLDHAKLAAYITNN